MAVQLYLENTVLRRDIIGCVHHSIAELSLSEKVHICDNHDI